MIKDVAYTLHGVNPPVAEFRHYYEERNGGIAADIAALLDVPFIGEVGGDGGRRGRYMVPVKTVDADTASLLRIGDETEFYGAKVSSMDMVGKAILHPTPSEKIPAFYSSEFAEYVAPLVLPGATAFSQEDAVTAYKDLVAKGHGVRMKMPNASDGNGQYTILSEEGLGEILAGQDAESIQEHGIVLETDVRFPQTISVGYAQIGSEKYSFIALQKNDMVEEFDEATQHDIVRNRYGGATVRVIRGDMKGLAQLDDITVTERDAIEASIAFCEAYKEAMGVVASRLSFDYLYGFAASGDQVAGITDITGRLGGTCPAIMVAAQELSLHKRQYRIDSEVTLNYDPSQVLPEEKDAKVYIDRPSLRLTSRVNCRYSH